MKYFNRKELLLMAFLFFIPITVFAVGMCVPFSTTYYINSSQEDDGGFLATVTAYSEIDSCHYPGCVTASGDKAFVGGIACPRNIELGRVVMISGQTYVCNDRTAKRFDGRYDIFMGYGKESHKKAIEFGRQELKIILK